MKDDEKAAEESAKGWIKFAEEMVPLTTIEVDTMLLLIKKSFLAGCKHARTPIKIDKDKPESWPPDGKVVLIFFKTVGENRLADGWILGNFSLEGKEKRYFWSCSAASYFPIEHALAWLPLPTIPTDGGEE
jgi:hypothetical protein